MKKGRLIAIEGIDACGKETQTNLLVKNLKRAGYKTITFSFPDYQTETGSKLKQILFDPKWANSDPRTIGFAELFALNFSEKKKEIEGYLKEGFIVVCDRYEPSDEAFQSVKLPKNEQRDFGKYIRDLCFGRYKIPKPDLIIFLDLLPELCEILRKNQKEKDIHEKNLLLQEKVYKAYKKLAQEKSWVSIKCFENKKILPKKEIAEKIWQRVSERLSIQKPKLELQPPPE